MKRLVRIITAIPLLVFPSFVLTQPAPPAQDVKLDAPDGTEVSINRDEFGVPHIEGDTEAAVFFGQGFAVAQDRLFQLEQFRLASLGRTSELDSSLLEQDIRVRTVFYTKEERAEQAESLRPEVKTMLESYGAGINAFLDSMQVNPAAYMPAQFALLGYQPEPWEMDHSIAIMQFFMRRFGQYGGTELDRAQELQQSGEEWFEANRPLNDPNAPPTVPAGDAGKAALGVKAPGIEGKWVEPDEVWALMEDDYESLSIPKLGSYAVLVSGEKSASGHVMQLGAPQMHLDAPPSPPDVLAIVNEVELWSDNLHIGGMTVAGIPGVIIGRNEHFAWTLTSGNSDNTDTFIETVPNGAFDVYRYNGEDVPFEGREEVFQPRGGEPITVPVYRTVHGPVIGQNLAENQVYSWQMTFWKEEMDMPSAFYDIWKAENLEAFEDALEKVPMNFNVFYADREQNIAYWHVGKLLKNTQNPGEIDPRLPRAGDGSEEWGDDPFLSFSELPQVVNPDQGYLVNWNNKPAAWWNQGDNTPWVTTAEDREERTNRVLHIENFVAPIDSLTDADLKEVNAVVRNTGSYPGSYQQVLILNPDEIQGQNLVPPGQSAFINMQGQTNANFSDQWPMYLAGEMKPFLFGSMVSSADAAEDELPLSVELDQNYPNPFNPVTTIRYRLPVAEHVQLAVYDVLGRRVARLIHTLQPAGEHEVVFDAGDLPSGLYLYRLTTPTAIRSRTFMVVK